MLVYWPDEDQTSIVDAAKVVEPELEDANVGVNCSINTGKQVYTAKITGIGKILMICFSA